LGPAAGGGQTDVGEPRELLGGDGEIGVAQDVAAADAQELPVLEAPERVPAGVLAREGGEAGIELGLELVAGPLPHDNGLQRPGEKLRISPEGGGDGLAGTPEPQEG